eukprot:3889066-Amphidinium_carterae.1
MKHWPPRPPSWTSSQEFAPTHLRHKDKSLWLCCCRGSKAGVRAIEKEGVKEVQTLQLGVAIRSAICIGKEVWTVDWKGQVSIRERDDATVITSEIPTNRFIWCITHIDPGLMWMGQEAQGISLFDTTKKSFKTTLTGGMRRSSPTFPTPCLQMSGAWFQ